VATPTRTQAQQRADDIRVFRAELARLAAEGVLRLDDGQLRRLHAHQDELLAGFAREFDIDRDVRAKQLSLGMRVASFLGALALAASVFFLFYQFWGLFPTSAQVAILVVAALGTFLAASWLRARDANGYFTKLAAMVAFACFVLNVVMLGQIFNITPSDKALVPLAALAFLLAYGCELRLLLAAGILCVVAFLSARAGAWTGVYWLHFGERPENFLPAALIIFSIPQVIDHRRFAGFAEVYRVFGLITLLMPVLILGHWGWISYLPLEPALIKGIYQTLGFILAAAAIFYGARRQWPEVVNTGVAFFVIFLYTMFYVWWWEIMPKYLFFLVVGMSAVLLLVIFRRLRSHGLGGGQRP
jgi:uncharacterized membrane protein